MAKFCGNCGKPLGKNDKVCGNCGTPVVTNEVNPTVDQDRSTNSKGVKKKVAVIGTVSLLLVVLIVVVIKAIPGASSRPNTIPVNNTPSSSTIQKAVSSPSTPEAETTPIPVAEKESIEERAKKAIKDLEVWDGSIAESFDGGDGTMENPYQIANGAQLAKLAQDTNLGIDFAGDFFVLTSDIILNDIRKWNFNISAQENVVKNEVTFSENDNLWDPIGWLEYSADSNLNVEKKSETPFSGSFNGDGHTIWGLCSRNISGLFGYVKGIVSNTNVACGSIMCFSGDVGTIAGWIKDTNISLCRTDQIYIHMDGSQGWIGGICGVAEGDCAIYDCSSNAVYIDSQNSYRSDVGGICGSSVNGLGQLNVSNCYSKCEIKICGAVCDDLTYNRVGGICGVGKNINNCISDTNITFSKVESDSGILNNNVAGGIAGACNGNIVNCGSYGNIIGICHTDNEISFGGIAANVCRNSSDTSDITISNCYVGGTIEVEDEEKSENVEMSGLVCNIFTDGNDKVEASVTDCYFVPSGSDQAIGSSSKEISLFTNQVVSVSSESDLKKSDTYQSWDFENLWVIDSKINDGLPIPRSLLELLG